MILLLIDMQPEFYASLKILDFWTKNIKKFNHVVFLQTKSNLVNCGNVFSQLINNTKSYKIITKKSTDGSHKLVNIFKHKPIVHFGGVNSSKCVKTNIVNLINLLPNTQFVHVWNGTADASSNYPNQIIQNFCQYHVNIV